MKLVYLSLKTTDTYTFKGHDVTTNACTKGLQELLVNLICLFRTHTL